MYRVRWAGWISGVFAATWMCVALSAHAARSQDDAAASSRRSALGQRSNVAARARGVEWIRPSASRRLISLRDGRVIAGNAVFDGAGGNYLGYAAPEVIEVLASGVALSIDARGHLVRMPIDRGETITESSPGGSSAAQVLVARPSRDGSLVFVVERRAGEPLRFSVKSARSLREIASCLLEGFDPLAPVFVDERNQGVVVAGRRPQATADSTSESRWVQLRLEGVAPRVVETRDLEGAVEAIAVDEAGGIRVAIRRGGQLDVLGPRGAETLISMSAHDVRSVIFGPQGDQVAVIRRRADDRTAVSLLASAPSDESSGVLWEGVIEHDAPTVAFSRRGEALFINGHSLLRISDARERRPEFVGGMPTLFGSWYALPGSSARDLGDLRRYETFDGGAVLEERRWGVEIFQEVEGEDLQEWGGVVLSVATGIGPSAITGETFETEMWSDRSGTRHASMRVPRSMSASGHVEYVVARDGGAGVSVRRLQVDEWLDAKVVESYRARLMNHREVR